MLLGSENVKNLSESIYPLIGMMIMNLYFALKIMVLGLRSNIVNVFSLYFNDYMQEMFIMEQVLDYQ